MILLAFELESVVQLYRKSNRARLGQKHPKLFWKSLRPTDLYRQITLPSNERLIVLVRFIDCFCLTMLWCFIETYKTIDQNGRPHILHFLRRSPAKLIFFNVTYKDRADHRLLNAIQVVLVVFSLNYIHFTINGQENGQNNL